MTLNKMIKPTLLVAIATLVFCTPNLAQKVFRADSSVKTASTASRSASKAPKSSDDSKSSNSSKTRADAQKEGPREKEPEALETATKFRKLIPIVPELIRGSDGLLSTFGQRAIQSQLVTSTNVKEPVLDAFPFSSGLPVEAVEPVRIPDEQFEPSRLKFDASTPVLDPISGDQWHFNLGAPFFAVEENRRVSGVSSATPTISATGPLFGGRASWFTSFEYRLSKAGVDGLGGSNNSEFRSFDFNTHLDIRAGRRHTPSIRFSLFSQEVDHATLNGLAHPEATPDYYMRGGNLFLADNYKTPAAFIIDSTVSIRLMHLSVLPLGSGPMLVIQQGELEGNYFDRLHRDSSRTEWKEAVQLPELSGLGNHQISFGGGFTNSNFDSTRVDTPIVLLGSDERDNPAPFGVIGFTGNGVESLGSQEVTGWFQDRWTPVRRVEFTLGMRYDRTTISRTNEWGPRAAFALLPFKNDRTVVRGGAGIFYDVMPVTVGTFTRSLERVVQFFDDGEPLTQVQTMANVLAKQNLNTSHVLGWNLEVDQQVAGNLFVRAKAEERRGENLLLVEPDPPTLAQSRLVLTDSGTSRYRALETTVNYRPWRNSDINFSYIRSDFRGDLNTFGANLATFEKIVIPPDRYALSRTDSPNRFLVWGDLSSFKGVMLAPAVDIHTGFPYAFFDADRHVPNETDFGRLPRTVSVDLGLYRDFALRAFDHPGKLRLGLRVYNLTNHFNPRDAQLGESEDQSLPILVGYMNNAGRTLRASVMFNF